jgi:hypothetical protein
MTSGRDDGLLFDAIDFPSVIFSDQAVEKRSNRPVSRIKENLDKRRRSIHSHHSELHPIRVRHGRVVVANQGLELCERKFLLNVGGRMPVGARKIFSPKSGELIVHDRIQLSRRRRRDHPRLKIMGHESRRRAERERENEKPRLGYRIHDLAVLSARRRRYL